MYPSMYCHELEKLDSHQRKEVEDNQNLVWWCYHRLKGTLPHNHHTDDDYFSIGILGLIRAVKTFNPERGAALSTWATAIITNHYKATRRYYRSHKPVLDTLSIDNEDEDWEMELECTDSSFYPEEIACNKALDELCREAFFGKFLSDKERKIVYYHAILGNTQGEVAERLGISQAHVSRMYNRAIRKMKAFMEIRLE